MFCHDYLPHPGGVEVVVWNLARRLADRHDVVIVSSAHGDAVGVSQEDGLEVHRLPVSQFVERRGIPYPLPLGPGIRRALAATANADVVHAHGALYAQTLLARRAARRATAPFVLTEHVGFVEYSSAVNAVQRLAWRTIGDGTVRRSDAVVALSSRVHDWLVERYGREVQFIGNGVDGAGYRPRGDAERPALRRSFGLPETEVLALFVGRDSAKKNFDVALAAPRDDYTLVVCGAARELKAERVIDLGELPYQRMPDLFACVDLMVHPATGEGFPLSVQEAIASGVPVVLLWDDGYRPLLPRELVVACDAPAEVAPRLAALAADPAARAALGAAGRDWAERQWSWDASVAGYERVYREVIDRASSRSASSEARG
ncbi:MAG: glycosyltransferase family 4 protein [Gemmatimonadales bacterium]